MIENRFVKGWNLIETTIKPTDLELDVPDLDKISQIINLPQLDNHLIAFVGNTYLGNTLFNYVLDEMLMMNYIDSRVKRINSAFGMQKMIWEYYDIPPENRDVQVFFLDNLEFTLFDNKQKGEALTLIETLRSITQLIILNIPTMEDLNAMPNSLHAYFDLTNNYIKVAV